MSDAPRPRISVVIPSFNHAGFIGQAIESVLADPGKDIELIVCDDASTDSSRDVIANYRDPRLRQINLPGNRGPSVALNTAIGVSAGEYIAALGSDDFFLPGTLRKRADFLDANPQFDAVFGMPRQVDEEGRPLNTGYGEFSHPFVGRDASRAEWLRRFFFSGNCLCHPTVMLRRQVHNGVGLYDPRLLNLQDLDLWIRMLVQGPRFFVLPSEVTARRVRSGLQNLSAPKVSAVLRSNFEYLQILRNYRKVPASYLYKVFANEVRTAGIAVGLSGAELLAEVGARSRLRLLQLSGLEALFEALAAQPEADCRRLFTLAGQIDPMAILAPPQAARPE
jgi:glycosyltransferase involved in cell wall biosynthesis